jgi:putative flippase GtrA
VYFQNKVLGDVPINFTIPHIFWLFSFILQWYRHVDNFIKSIVVFVDNFLFDKKVVIMMHANDLWVLKDIRSILENN